MRSFIQAVSLFLFSAFFFFATRFGLAKTSSWIVTSRSLRYAAGLGGAAAGLGAAGFAAAGFEAVVFFLPAPGLVFGPLRVRALVRVRCPCTGRPLLWRCPR